MAKRDVDLKDEARGRFECYIAAELKAKAEVDTRSLANGFFDQEEKLLRRIATGMLLQMLVKWADDILAQSVGIELARNGGAQLTLPLDLEGIEVPGAISFISGANKVKFVANYKVVGWQMESHAYLLRKRAQEVLASSAEWDRLWDILKPFMEADPKMTLPEALKKLADGGKPN